MELENILPDLLSWFVFSLEHIVFGVFVIMTVGILRNEGFRPYLRRLKTVMDVTNMLIKREAELLVKETADKMPADFTSGKRVIHLPEKGM